MAYTIQKQREYARLYRGPYYQAHKTEINAYSTAYIKKFPDKHKLYVKRYYEKNKLACLMYQTLLGLAFGWPKAKRMK